MSPTPARLALARRTLVVASATRALVLAAAVALGVLVLGALLDAVFGLPLPVRRPLPVIAITGGVAMLLAQLAGRVLRTLRASDERLALWFEDRLPTLRYALVTSVDPRFAGRVPALEREVERAPLEGEAAHAARVALRLPAIAVAGLALILFLAPSGAVARIVAAHAGDALERPGAAMRAAADPLATIVVRVTPPAYSGLPRVTYDDPSTVAALVGSRVSVEGRGSAVSAVRAVLGVDTLRATSATNEPAAEPAADRWRITLPLPAQASAVRLLGPVRERVLVLDPIADSVPAVRLEEPSRDSVLRVATGRVTLRAELRDDHGLGEAAFEFIVSSGAGETFTFRSGRLAARRFDAGVRSARIDGVLRLDTLALAPGDLIHLRAVAVDRNDVTGPGTGASETRTLRIARADEYDSVSVDPMPPTEPEKNALSQRMLLLLTQELQEREPRLAAEQVTRESRSIAIEQTKLRKRVGEVVFLRLGEDNTGEHSHFAGDGHEHGPEGPVDPSRILAAAEAAANVDQSHALEGEGDETPVVAINKPLLEAYNHMWRASTELEIANPGGAIPWMERAIEALQRARAAERIYLRGRPPRVVVDLARVRGTGKEKGSPDSRVARAPLDAARAERLVRFDAALARIAADPAAAADSLLLLRLTLPDGERAAATAVDAAAAAVRRGGDVTGALQRARRALAGAPLSQRGLGPWGI